jgi:DNA invertase Pin-like site-specific DNA recombinase
MTTTGGRLISYIRVSALGDRDADSERTQTIRQQREANEAIAKLSGAKIVDEVVAKNASGGKAWPEPKLAELIARIDAGEADGIVVYDLSRYGRSLRALEVIERWAEEDKTFLSASDKFDASTPSGRMTLRMMMVVARYYWEETKDRFAKAQQRAIARGAYVGSTPFGYLRTEDGTLVPDDEYSAPIVKRAFALAAAGDLNDAVDYLLEAAPERRWRTDETRRLLRSRVYLGEIRLGELSNDAGCDPLVTPAIWQAAQTEPRSRRTNGSYPLTGLLACGRCGSPLTGGLQTVKGRTYRRYRCSSTACRGGTSINADKLETHMRAKLKAALASKGFRQRFDVDGLEGAAAALERTQARLQEYLADTDVRDLVGAEAWKVGVVARQQAVDEALASFDALNGREQRSQTLPLADDLDDGDALRLAVGIIVDELGAIIVAPGRGTVESRVPLDNLDG